MRTIFFTYYSLDRSTAAHIISFLFLGWAVGSPLSGVLTNYFGRCKLTMQGGTIVSFVVICPHVTFLDTMLLGTTEQQIHATSERSTTDLRILSMSFYMPADLITARLLPLLKRLSQLR